jgi:hypothetical protein
MDTMEEKNFDELKRRTEVSGELVWHYTNWRGLHGVVTNKELWLTHFAYLNDTQECLYALRQCVGQFEDGLGHVDAKIQRMLAGEEEYPRTFLASFSRSFDSLEQWRAYSPGSAGFALGFDAGNLNKVMESHHQRMIECQYDIKPLIERCKAMMAGWKAEREEIDRIESDPNVGAVEKHSRSKGFFWQTKRQFDELMNDVVEFKNPCFEKEKEVRIVAGGDDYNEVSKIEFELRGSLIVPFTRLPLEPSEGSVQLRENPGLKYFGSVLRGVMLGPTVNELNVRSLRDFLTRNCGPVDTCRSKVPLRTKG